MTLVATTLQLVVDQFGDMGGGFSGGSGIRSPATTESSLRGTYAARTDAQSYFLCGPQYFHRGLPTGARQVE
jgi:hypothetical protein